MQSRKLKAIAATLLRWYASNARDLPWRREPYCRDPYCIHVSEVMLQQTQVKTVLPYWEGWMRALPDLQSLAAAQPETLHKLWEGLGYYRRVRHLQAAARVILERHAGVFPSTLEQVLELPGIGRYTAGAICSIAFGQPTPILDGNVMRVLTRVFGIAGDPREQPANAALWRLAEELVQAADSPGRPRSSREFGCGQFNQALMELGALVCVPRQPRCGDCPLAELCVARRQGQVERYPELARRASITARRFVALVIELAGRFLVCQRPAGGINAHLWEFPNLEVTGGQRDLSQAAATLLGLPASTVRARGFPLGPLPREPWCVLKHSITRYRIELEVFRFSPADGAALQSAPGRWVSWGELDQLPLSGVHRRIRAKLGSERGPGAAGSGAGRAGRFGGGGALVG